MNPAHELQSLVTRRHFFGRLTAGIGTIGLASLLNPKLFAAGAPQVGTSHGVLPGLHFAPKAKRIIYLFQSGGPSHLDLFDHKPELAKRFAENLPDSVRKGQRLTGMTATQETFPVAPSKYKFRQHGKSGAWLSELLPHTAGIADELCFIKSLHTEAINHDPAITFCQTGAQLAGRPSFGSWVSYGLGSENKDLP